MRFEYFFRHRHRVTPRDRRPGALQVQIYFSIDEGDRVHAEGPASAKSSTSTGSWIVDRGESRVRKEGGWRTCSAPPAGENIHGLGGVEGNSNDDALRIIDKRQGDGVKKPAGWATTAFRRLDRTRLDFHRGRRFDGKRGRGRAELRGWDAIDIDCNGPVVVVEVHDRHDRRGGRALRNRRRGRNVQGEDRRRAFGRGTPSKPDKRGLRGV